MPPTQLGQNQIRPVDRFVVADAEKRFCGFWGLSVVLFLVIGMSMAMDVHTRFWEGNRLWAIGNLLICVSVLHARHFDIKRNAAPHNERIDPNDLSKMHGVLEVVAKYSWIFGFIFVAISRWQ